VLSVIIDCHRYVLLLLLLLLLVAVIVEERWETLY
jgi:hypothetical protein